MAFYRSLLGLGALSALRSSLAFNNAASTNLAVYWGQNSYGATHTNDPANWQQRLSHYCQDSTIDAIPIAFMDVFFGSGNEPSINLANTCNNVDNVTFTGTTMPECQALAADIEACQAAGKIVTLSLGGASGAASFSSDSQAQQFATLIWDQFLGGSSSIRPLGNAVLDGVDLDIEGGGGTGFAAFVTQIRSLAAGASKQYFVTGAPQCPFPDGNLGSVINAVGFDALYVQFYNNFCGVQNFNNPNAWNFDQWDTWAKTTSPNKNVKIYIGAPASSTAAGSGYVDAATLGSIVDATKALYSSFGGVMLWDASQAYANGRFDVQVKNILTGASGITATTTGTVPTTTVPPGTTSSKPPTTTTPTSGSCAGVGAWNSAVAYVGGSQVTFNGHLWSAQWWTEADTPGGSAGVWIDDGACTSNGPIQGVPTAAAVTSHSAAASVSSVHPASVIPSSAVATAAKASSAPVAPAPVSSAIASHSAPAVVSSAPAIVSHPAAAAVSSVPQVASGSASAAASVVQSAAAVASTPSKRSRVFRF